MESDLSLSLKGGGESVSQLPLKDQAFSNFPNQNPRFEQQLEEPTPLPDGAVAPGHRGSHQKYRKQPHAQ